VVLVDTQYQMPITLSAGYVKIVEKAKAQPEKS
jgi:hypothetical protein